MLTSITSITFFCCEDDGLSDLILVESYGL